MDLEYLLTVLERLEGLEDSEGLEGLESLKCLFSLEGSVLKKHSEHWRELEGLEGVKRHQGVGGF